MSEAEEQPVPGRNRLLEAAVAAFSEKGFHGTTTRDIASGAGMSPAALYVHHRSKEELLHLIAADGHRRVLDLARRTVASASGPTAQLEALMRTFAAHHAQQHTVARVVNYELAALAPDHLAEVMDLRQQIDAVIRRVVEDGMDSGEFVKADPGMVTTAISSLGIDIARWYREDGAWTPEEIGEEYADLALRLVGARRSA